MQKPKSQAGKAPGNNLATSPSACTPPIQVSRDGRRAAAARWFARLNNLDRRNNKGLCPPAGRAADESPSRRDVPLEERGLKAIAPFVKVAKELNLYHGMNVGLARLAASAALPEIAPTLAPLALTHSPGVTASDMVEDEQSCAKARSSSLKQLASVNLCADAACDAAGLSPTGQIQASCLDLTRWL
jgi:hypothetical protein